MPYSAIGWFCDDVREEKGNKETIIGIYSDAVTVASFPGAFKRIVVYVRIHADVNEEVNALKLLLRVPGLDEEEVADFSLEGLREAQERARGRGIPYVAFVTQVTIEPLEFLRGFDSSNVAIKRSSHFGCLYVCATEG